MKALCKSCVYYKQCAGSFVVEHTQHLLQSENPSMHTEGGSGYAPWSYEESGLTCEFHCTRYKYIHERKLSSCATLIGPHKLRLDFTKINEERNLEGLDSWMLNYM